MRTGARSCHTRRSGSGFPKSDFGPHGPQRMRTGAAGDQGCQAHGALLAQWVLRGIRRAKGRTRWAPDSPAAVGLGAGGDGPEVDGRPFPEPLGATSQARLG